MGEDSWRRDAGGDGTHEKLIYLTLHLTNVTGPGSTQQPNTKGQGQPHTGHGSKNRKNIQRAQV